MPGEEKSILVKALTNPLGAWRRGRNELQDYLEEMDLSLSDSRSTIINQKEIRIVGLMRSGNHAITNWIRQQQPGKTQYLNNIPCGKNPYQHFYEKHLEYNKHPKTIRKLKQKARGKLPKCDCLFYSYEDYSLQQVSNPEFEGNHDRYFGRTLERYDVLIMRDPFNLMASRFKSGFIQVQAPDRTAIELWLEYAREYLAETQYLNQRRICVNYNQWTRDRNYREQLAQQLDLEFSDAGFNQVKSQGGGSSFEGQTLDGQASKMDVLNRWKVYEEDPSYRQIFSDPNIFEYSEKIFGELPGTNELRMN